MDPVTVSAVAAVVALVTALGNGVASAAGKDAYEGLKRLVSKRFTVAESALLQVEAVPSDTLTRNTLATRLEEAGAFRDAEFQDGVKALLGALVALRDKPELPVLFDFDELEAAQRFEITDVSTLGTVLKARKASFKGDVKISGIHQTRGDTEKH